MCCGNKEGSYLRLAESCLTQLKAQGPSRTCNESKEEEQVPWTSPSKQAVRDEEGRRYRGTSLIRNTCPSQDHRRAPGKGLLQGPGDELLTMSEVPLYVNGPKGRRYLLCSPLCAI